MTAETAASAHGRDIAQTTVPGIAVFVFADIASFMLFFGVFMSERMKAPVEFATSAAMLDVDIGLANTLILITSGWCVARAEKLEHGRSGAGRPWLIFALLIGAAFAVLKAWEYGGKIAAGITPSTDAFFSYYFVFTGIHLIHYLAGMAILALLTLKRFTAQSAYPAWLRAGAMYWHMVDILWMFIFPLLYLQALP